MLAWFLEMIFGEGDVGGIFIIETQRFGFSFCNLEYTISSPLYGFDVDFLT